MSESKRGSGGGIGVLGLLGVAFVTLKLCNVIDWSWWYVTMPFWVPVAFVLTIVFCLLVFAGVCFGLAKIGEKL